ncbi:hypothetical protein ABZ915_47145 [Streptomyces sp. NPDC046915]|uniref:hypothetical protein n=1 Tax=Streptomyces sp. NPDC046915 TaxID=3155257 RepID=UPI0033F98E88
MGKVLRFTTAGLLTAAGILAALGSNMTEARIPHGAVTASVSNAGTSNTPADDQWG